MKRLALVSMFVCFGCSEGPLSNGALLEPPLTQPIPDPVTGTYDLGVSNMRLKGVPPALIERARAKAEKVVTLSLEDVAHKDLTVALTSFQDGQSTTLVLHPGDPCASGVVQVFITKEDIPIALFDVIQWVRYPNGTSPNQYAGNQYTTGTSGDSDWPQQKFRGMPSPECR